MAPTPSQLTLLLFGTRACRGRHPLPGALEAEGSSLTDLQRHPFLPPAPSMAPVPTSWGYSDFWVKDLLLVGPRSMPGGPPNDRGAWL